MTQVPMGSGRRLVLLGAGPTHRRLLQRLARHPLPGLRVTLLTAQPQVFLAERLPGFIACEHGIAACAVPLAGLATRSGVRLVAHRIHAIDASARALTLDNGDQLAYDFLSLDPEPVQERAAQDAAMPGAREHGLFLCPVDAFGTLWPRVRALPTERLRSLVVVGEGILAVEVALAVRQALPPCAINLVTGGYRFLDDQPERLRMALRLALQRAFINVLEDGVLALRAGAVRMGCGADLVCDVPIIATGPVWPAGLLNANLALDGKGYTLAVDDCLRSSSHAEVFVAPLHARAAVARSLHANLGRMVMGQPTRPARAVAPALRFVSIGPQRAALAWRSWCVQGYMVWQWMQWIDRNAG